MKKHNQTIRRLATLGILIIIGLLIARENLTKRPDQLYQTAGGQVEMCLSCHKTEVLDMAHNTEILGCSACHLGEPMAIDKETAHKNIVKNPGDLRVVDKTCGVEGCHAVDVHKVKNSLMATNRGIIATLLYYWDEAPNQNGDYSVEKLINSGKTSLALDYYRKLCATCHLWKQRGDLPGFFGEKGGGCTACHYVTNPDLPSEGSQKGHPLITKKVPMRNCIRCHNRSGRIGISFTGVYESDGSGAPFNKGGLSTKRLPGDRFFQELPPDAHYKKGMVCIDCHTRNEIMGDGNNYAHFEEQLEITCTTCHTRSTPGVTKKKNKLTNINQNKEKAWVLTGKIDNVERPLLPPLPATCEYPGHSRLACQACHSTWVPQCYGCHVKRDMTETHLDKLTMQETKGWWEEGRSYIRYEKPALGVWGDRIMPVTPGCQDVVTLIDEQGVHEKSFYSFTMAAIDPHTTQKSGRTCAACHSETKTIGLGEGTVWIENGKWQFKPVYQPLQTEAGETPPLDSFVTIDGVQLQKGFRPDMRAFNKTEIANILRVGLCLECHPEINDSAYQPFSKDRICPEGTKKMFNLERPTSN